MEEGETKCDVKIGMKLHALTVRLYSSFLELIDFAFWISGSMLPIRTESEKEGFKLFGKHRSRTGYGNKLLGDRNADNNVSS